MKKLFLVSFIALTFLLTGINAQRIENYDCSSETNPLLVNISILNENIINLSSELENYKSESIYYQGLYKNQTINLTNRELITLHQNINNLNIEINDIKSELSFLKLTLKVSIPIISFTFFSLLGLSIYLRKQLKRSKKDE